MIPHDLTGEDFHLVIAAIEVLVDSSKAIADEEDRIKESQSTHLRLEVAFVVLVNVM